MPEVAPHLAFPLRVRAGRFLTVEQDSPRHVQDQAEVVLRTRPQTFEHDPDFGLRDLVARTGPAAPPILEALRRVIGADFDAVEDTSELADRIRRVVVSLREAGEA